MKTREQAEQRALELFPKTHIATVNQLHEVSRQAFLQCWDEMQADKQTCGFCVEPKQEEEKPQPQERVDKLGTNTPDKSKTYISPSTEIIAAFVNDEWMQFHRSDTIQDNGLREAAEKVVYEWHNSIGEECIDAAMVELVKVLNSKKQ